MRSVISLGLFLLCCACGPSGDDNVPSAPGGRQFDSGVDDPYSGKDGGAVDGGDNPSDGGGRADAGADASAASKGPSVAIVSPTAAQNPDSDELVTTPVLKVRCSVERAGYAGAAGVNASSVKLGLQRPDDPETWIEPPVNALSDTEFEAVFEVATLPNGPLHFRCVASDLASMPNQSSARLDTFLDLGPSIQVVSPSGPVYALKTPVPVEFKVKRNPVSSEDTEADVDVADIKLLVGGVEWSFEESQTTPGLYKTSIDFGDDAKFPVPPDGAQLVFRATNKRSPNPVTRTVSVDIVIDGAGPTITVREPMDGQIVHGTKKLVLDVKDPSGVRASSVVANFNVAVNGETQPFVIRDWNRVDSVFSQSFDTNNFSLELTRLTISVTATDEVGNEGKAVLTIKLDNLPPVISLDPPLIREWRKSGDLLVCSALFDPVGNDVPNDGDPLINAARYRMLVEDRTNTPVGAPGLVVYLAGINNNKVELYMQRDPENVPLLIDTDDDGYCDEVNYAALTEAERPVSLNLAPVNPAGTAWFKFFDEVTDFDGDTFTPDEIVNLGMGIDNVQCQTKSTTQPPSQPQFPNSLCPGYSPMFRVVPGRVQGRPPGVYAIRPSNSASSGECTGEYWELLGIANPGWICIAGRAEDTIGNIGVSEPLRLCYGDNGNMTPDCSAAPMPSCTDGCIFSEAQRFHHTDGDVDWYFP